MRIDRVALYRLKFHGGLIQFPVLHSIKLLPKFLHIAVHKCIRIQTHSVCSMSLYSHVTNEGDESRPALSAPSLPGGTQREIQVET